MDVKKGESMPVTLKEAKAALEVLKKYGKAGYCRTAQVTDGHCIGLAVARLTCGTEVVKAATTMLEDWNAHLATAAIAAIEQGQGTVERKGRQLTITLPEWWK